MASPRKVLIIKTGFSEFLDRGISTTVSLGDVLICTSILHLYKNDIVTWLGSWQSRELLEDNPYINTLLIFGTDAFREISREEYDVIVNLEKDNGICTFLNHIKADRRFGFYFCDIHHDIRTFNPAAEYLLVGQEHHTNIHKSAFEILYETVEAVWKGEGLILGKKPSNPETTDIGFNYEVGTKWPTKAWPVENWRKLEELLRGKCTVSWQQGHKDLTAYIHWINSCRVIVTSDSLGQAIGLALNKKVITLYGPTNFRRMQGVLNVEVVPAQSSCPHMPCFLPVCKHDRFCMSEIRPEDVAEICERKLNLVKM